ncbi:MAG: hypothetical protein MZV70_66505 [Desulfobacterales bacterium]|nr:hypothetical protein [Desulfobacterales bacterium]
MAAAIASLKRLQFKVGGVRDFKPLGIDLGGKAAPVRLHRGGRPEGRPGLPLEEASRRVRRRHPGPQSQRRHGGLPLDEHADGARSAACSSTANRRSRGTSTGRSRSPGRARHPSSPAARPRPARVLRRPALRGPARLALALGGRRAPAYKTSSTPSPTVSTPFGPITYPDRITIVSTEFAEARVRRSGSGHSAMMRFLGAAGIAEDERECTAMRGCACGM